MSILGVAAASLLAAQCAPATAPQMQQTLLAVARTESGLSTLAINDNNTRQAYSPETIQDAVRVATELILRGHNVDLGLMQINSANLQHVRLTIATAFDACESLRAGAQILMEDYRAALRSALSRYNTGDPVHGIANGYVYRVEANAEHMMPQVGTAAGSPSPPKPDDWNVSATARRELDERAKGADSSLLTFNR